MSLESEVKKVDEDIVSKINDLSKEIVVKEYQPLFEKVKKIALTHMRQNGIEIVRHWGIDWNLEVMVNFMLIVLGLTFLIVMKVRVINQLR